MTPTDGPSSVARPQLRVLAVEDVEDDVLLLAREIRRRHPALTILLDLDVEVGLGRKKKDNEWNRLDAYTVEFHQRVRAGYLEMVKAEPDRWVVVDAGQAWEAVQEELRSVIIGRII
jgi:thymidylate kinase